MKIELLSVIVPIYKKEKTIYKELKNLHEILSTTPYKFEIIGVVDGINLDDSYRKAKQYVKSNVRIYGYKENHGKGVAVRYGMKKSKGNIVTFIDSGGDIDPQGIIMLIEHMKWYQADIVVGSKLHPASKVHDYPLFKTKVYYLINKILFRLKIRDTQTGLKAYKRKTIQKVLDRLVIKRFAFDVEILAVANYLGYKNICDSPVEVNYDKNDSTYVNSNFLKTALNVLLDTLSVWYRIYILKYYDDGRVRERVYDKDLDMYINTGNLLNNKQIIVQFVNKYISIFTNLIKKGKNAKRPK